MLDKLNAIIDRYHYLEERLSDPEVISDQKIFAKTNKEYKDLSEIVTASKEYQHVMESLDNVKLMQKDDDADIRAMAYEEEGSLSEQKEKIEEKIKALLIPKDPEDSKDVIFEIRSGTGGDEASIFAGDLYRMYTRYFDLKE
jgi:peptide chain release factor 1